MDAVVIDHPVHGEETLDTTDVKIILAAGPWVMTILDRSGIDGPPAGLSLTAILAFHLAIDDEQHSFYSAKPIFSHIGTGRDAAVLVFQPALIPHKVKYFLLCVIRK